LLQSSHHGIGLSLNRCRRAHYQYVRPAAA